MSLPVTFRNKAPAFMFYPGDFLSSPDVRMMSICEKGAYLMLLFSSWQTDHPGFLLNNEDRIRRLAELSPEQWRDSREIILGKWPVAPHDPTLRYNPRLFKEACKQQQNRELKSKAGKKSAAQRIPQALPLIDHPTVVEPDALDETEIRDNVTAIQQKPNSKATRVARKGNTCSENPQQKANLSIALSTSYPSTLRSEGEVVALPAAPSPTRARKKKFAPPLLNEVQTYADEKYPGDPITSAQVAAFFDHFESNGWLVGGKAPMVDWQASFRSWMRRAPIFQPARSHPTASGHPSPSRSQIAPVKCPNPNQWS